MAQLKRPLPRVVVHLAVLAWVLYGPRVPKVAVDIAWNNRNDAIDERLRTGRPERPTVPSHRFRIVRRPAQRLYVHIGGHSARMNTGVRLTRTGWKRTHTILQRSNEEREEQHDGSDDEREVTLQGTTPVFPFRASGIGAFHTPMPRPPFFVLLRGR